MFEQDISVFIERAHRLGAKKNGKPRPIIVAFTYYKQKQHILRNSYKFAGSNINVSEDFSKPTLAIHKTLVEHAREAMSKLSNITRFRIQYRRVLLTYRNTESERLFHKSYSLYDIKNGPANWYEPKYSN